MPPPSWLVRDVVPAGPQGSFSVLYGPSGAGKSFVALDMALSVAAGLPWQGHDVDEGFVAYVSAEGTAGLRQRVNAWLQGVGVTASEVDIAWLLEAVPVFNASEDLDTLLARFDEMAAHGKGQPAFVILDTLARCFEGNENETEDMGNFIKGTDRIRMECGCAVMAIHHTSKGGTDERGNGALRAASDAMIRVLPGARGMKQTQGVLTVSCEKQKEALPFATGIGRLVPVEGTGSVRVLVDWLHGADEQ